jgi:hypothetical protein
MKKLLITALATALVASSLYQQKPLAISKRCLRMSRLHAQLKQP